MESFDNFVSEFRKQRHDFMNDIQVIYGYLQLDRKDEAIEYINKISINNKVVSKIYTLGDERFGFVMEKLLKRFTEKEISIEVDIEIGSFSKKVFELEYNKKLNLVNNIIDEFENNKCKFVYIYIFEDELGESLLIANGESCANELDWMEDWDVIESQIQDMRLHKYSYNNNFAYRLTFTI